MKKLTNYLFRAMAASCLALPMLTSCYDDTGIWDKFDEIENRLESLESSLNAQLQALNTMISAVDGKTTVSSCEKKADGSYDVTLSNGTKFTVYPKGKEYSSLVSVITVDGVQCWATYDANGNLVALTDNAGKPVPVVKDNYRASVEVVTEDGVIYLVIDGKKYMTGYDTEDLVEVFSSCEQLKDASGNVYAMKFTFGEGISITVTVDGYKGVIFKLADAINASVISEYYVANEETQSFLLEMTGVVDYIMQIPDGWRVAERVDEYTEETYIDITAPAVETINAGAAVAEGELKVVAVVDGGKAAVSKLTVSTEAFKTFEVNGTKAVVTPYAGVQKFVYGVTLKNEYDEAAILSKVEEILQTTGDVPAGYGVAENGINVTHAETLGAELLNNQTYVFWAIPALYNEDGYFVKEGMFNTSEFSNMTVQFNKVTESLFDAEIDVTFKGVSKIYAGTIKKTEGYQAEIIRLVNNGAYTPVAVSDSYKGKASEFPTAESNSNVEFVPGTTYVSWIVPVDESSTYTVNNLICKEFTTFSIQTGSTINVTYGNAVVTPSTINIPVSSTGAELIYYVYLPKAEGDRIANASNDTKAEYIFEHENCVNVKGGNATAAVEKLTPNTTMWLYAVAVDKEGKYGKVNSVSATTAQLEFNTLTVNVTDIDVSSNKATFKIEVSGGTAEDYVYWFGQESDDFWVNPKYLGGTTKIAQQYMALYPQDEHITRCMSKYGKIAADGNITFTELAKTTNYILVVSAKDKSGKYSQAGYKMVTTLSANLGTIVREGSAEWNSAKEQVKINWLKDKFIKGNGEFATFAFEYSGPKNLTAFILCASDETFEHDPKYNDVEARIIDIEKTAGRRYDSSPIYYDQNGDYLSEPAWYDPTGEIHYGGMAQISEYYAHGYPQNGHVAYFAEGAHDYICGSIEAGVCSNYSAAMTAIQNRLNLDWYKEKFAGYNVMKYHENAAEREAAIEKAAQDLLDFYKPYYENKTPHIFENNGDPIEIKNPAAIGADDKGQILDDVFVVLKDNDGNYYEPMKYEVPAYFR